MFVGEALDLFQANFTDVPSHIIVNQIQTNQFELNKNNPKNRVFQMDFTMAYECEYQNEVKSALWTCLTVNLLTAACFFDSKTQTFLICTDSESGLAG